MLVDCGLFQGYKQLRLRNWKPLPVALDHIEAVVLTHAHLDHSGYLPLLVKEGFAGSHGLSRHAQPLPLCTRQDALDCLSRFKSVGVNKVFEPIKGWRMSFSSAGHILGAASVLVKVAGRRILFSGDLGRPDDLLMNPPDSAPGADTVLMQRAGGCCTTSPNMRATTAT